MQQVNNIAYIGTIFGYQKIYNSMAIQGVQTGVSYQTTSSCADQSGCPQGICPDFIIKQHDTKPVLKVSISDCDGPLDLTGDGLIVEMNMWANAKLKKALTVEDSYFSLTDNVGFNQIMVGDVVVMDRVRSPENMLVTAFDETNKLVQVQRGYHGTTASAWARGTGMKIFRALNVSAEIESILEDIPQVEGPDLVDQLVETHLTYQWTSVDTCSPGCFWVEFKLLKMSDEALSMLSFTPSLTPDDFGCSMGEGVEWVRRFPVDAEGFLVKIMNSNTREI